MSFSPPQLNVDHSCTGTSGILSDPNFNFTTSSKEPTATVKKYMAKSFISFVFAGFVNGFVVDFTSQFFGVVGTGDGPTDLGFVLRFLFKTISGILGLTISNGIQSIGI